MSPIPQSQRVVYRKNPLEEVVCQLRFPPILRIDSEPPAKFQEKIRGEYPVLEQVRAIETEPGMPPIPPEVMRMMGMIGRPVYRFTSGDSRWQATLARDFISLTDRKYDRWETFQQHLDGPLSALKDEYNPAFFTRIGLRYRDVIRRSALGLEGVAWSELLAPHVAGELASLAEEEVQITTRQIEVRLEKGLVRILHGLRRDAQKKEAVYVIDADFFLEGRTEAKDVLEALAFFNRLAGRLFRWCIRDRLHNAMEPHAL